MRRYVFPAVPLALFFLAGRFCTELGVHADGDGGAAAGVENGDVDASGKIDISDVVYLATWLFMGGPAPKACADGAGHTPDQLEALDHITMVDLPDGQGGTVRTIRISGVNLQIVNGLGTTCGTENPNGTLVNGLGNLIVGYQELRLGEGVENLRNGSHNVVIGREHNYQSIGGLVLGEYNTVSDRFCAVSGGSWNTAAGPNCSVSGGFMNDAGGGSSSISGGSSNTTSGGNCSISGGYMNDVFGTQSSISGGEKNSARGQSASISGGFARTASGEFDWRAGDLFQDQ